MKLIGLPKVVTSVKQLLQHPVKTDFVHMIGRAISVRKQKNVTFVELSDGSTMGSLQVVLKDASAMSVGVSISIAGRLYKAHDKKKNIDFYELRAEKYEIIGTAGDNENPVTGKNISLDNMRNVPHLRCRTPLFHSIFKVRNAIMMASHNYYQSKDFVHINSPILTSNDCEGAGESFIVEENSLKYIGAKSEVNEYGVGYDSRNDFFKSKANLTVSGQLHLEPFCGVYPKVYTLGPTFRREPSNTRAHLAEFYMLEAESVILPSCITSNVDIGQHPCSVLMHEIHELNGYIMDHLGSNYSSELALIEKTIKSETSFIDRVKLMELPPGYIRYEEAIDILSKKGIFNIAYGEKLARKHELYISEIHYNGRPIFIVDYPADIKAFYMKRSMTGNEVECFDYILPGIGELAGGSIREDRLNKLYRNNTTTDPGQTSIDRIPFLSDTRRFGSLPHGGYGIGFERLIMHWTGINNIKDTIPYPIAAGSTLL